MTDPFQSEPCDLCGWRHRLDDWKPQQKPRQRVETLVEAGFMDTVPAGSIGTVIEWSQYGGPLHVRVEFPWRDEYGYPVRANYRPCQLEIL